MKKIRSLKYRWYEVGDYYCQHRAVMSPNCVHKMDIKQKIGLNKKQDLNQKCNGVGVVSGGSAERGLPVSNGYWLPDVVGSWCWNKKNKQCDCDCSIYTDEVSCNSGYLNIDNKNCIGDCYCWGCNWS